jgi:hypothetical protein
MEKGFFKIAEQIENYGFYGEIDLECTLSNENRLHVDDEFNEWLSGIQFGVSYFLEHSPEISTLDVRINYIKSHAIDTTNNLIAFITIKALVMATKCSIKRDVYLDRKLRAFVYPK